MKTKAIKKNALAAQACNALFSPFVLLVDGLMACEARYVLQRFATALSTKWSTSYGEVMGWVQTRLSLLSSEQQTYVYRGQG